MVARFLRLPERTTSKIFFGLSLTVLLGISASCGNGATELDPSAAQSTTTAPDAPATDTTVPEFGLLLGVVDPTVISLQEALDLLGYEPGPIDGLLGPGTAQAVRAFQADMGIEPTSYVNAETARAIAEASPETERIVVEALQTALTELGFYAGLIDGIYGPEFEAAVADYQASVGLEATGEFTNETFELMIVDYDEQVTQAHIEAAGYDPSAGTPDGGSVETGEVLARGADGPEVAALQRRLAELGYRPGEPDGRYGAQTASAVMAFEKREGIQRDGEAGPTVQARLQSPEGAGPLDTETGPRVEVDLDRQIAFIIDSGALVTTINISSGSGRTYDKPGGGTAVAYTPTGEFVIERSVDGLREAPLGSLYRPLYFKEGWAIHGSSSVPAYPASHGCVRTANVDQDFIFSVVGIDDAVSIYGVSPGAPDEGEPGF